MAEAPQKRSFPITVPQFTDDGRRLHIFRQSSLKKIDDCLELARRLMSGELERHDSDSSALGTAAHAAIEASIQGELSGQGWLSLDEMLYIAITEFDELSAAEGFLWIKTKNASTIHKRLERILIAWWGNVQPRLIPEAAELMWGPITFHEDDKRVIQMTGCIDYVDLVTGLADWKTASREWTPWEHKRWDIQPTIYTWAHHHEFDEREVPSVYPFTFHVLYLDGSYQEITVQRHRGDWEWVKQRCLVVAELIEAAIPRWPMNDNQALCSPKWCPAWDTCKGQFYAPGWPEVSEPAPPPSEYDKWAAGEDECSIPDGDGVCVANHICPL